MYNLADNSHYAIKAKTIIAEQQDYHDHYLLLKQGKIVGLQPNIATDFPCLDFGSATLIPGLIDLHIHGREGCDVMDASMASMHTISRSLAQHGVTGFLATTVTSSWPETLAALEIIGEATTSAMPGARVLGGYSEGLFFSNEHKGAHNEQFFLPLTRQRIDAMLEASRHQLKILALAPEIDDSDTMIRYLGAQGVKVMLGHSDATYQQTVTALNAGACGGVHVFNGMRGIHHREPGCTGAVLLNDCQVEVIADGVHLHPAILQMILRLKTSQQISLISDCINAGGLKDGEYQLGKMAISVCDGIARTHAGSLAGSTLTLERAIANLMHLTDASLRDAVHMASLSPAKFLGIADDTGSIAPGKRADLTLLDETGAVCATWIAGQTVFSREDRPAVQLGNWHGQTSATPE